MKTISKLRMMMMAIVAIVCGMTLSSCGDDDDDTPTKKVDRVEMTMSISMSQDLSDMILANIICTNVQADGAHTTTIKLNDGMEKKTALTATKFPAKFTTVTNAFKKRDLKLKSEYEIAFAYEIQFVTYYTDGSSEVTPVRPETTLSNKFSTTLGGGSKVATEEEAKQIADTYQNIINGLLDYTFNLTADGTKVTIIKG